MKRFGNVILKKWFWFLFAAVVLGEAAVFLFFGEIGRASCRERV